MGTPAPGALLGGRVALVTGAGSGIGRATALLLAEHGAAVVAADREAEAGAETAQAITAAGGRATAVPTDVALEDQVRAMVATAVERHGRLDIAVNNAGVAPPVGPVEELDADVWDRSLAVNLRGVWLCLKHELRVMLPGGGGSIVNISSVAGLVGNPGAAAYAAAKHGVIGLTRSAAAEHGRAGIRVNAVAPGLTRTGMVAQLVTQGGMDADALAESSLLGRAAEPREVAEAVLWLASPLASYVTGAVLAVDGGATAL